MLSRCSCSALVYVGAHRRALRRRRQRDHDPDRGRRPAARCSSSPPTSSRCASMGAQEVSPQEAPELHAMIERLCIQADLPKPRIGVVELAMPNAFAMGRSKKAATVCATTGILELLSPAELEGVMAHELTHVANRDVMIMTLAALLRLAGVDDRPVRVLLRRRRRRRRRPRDLRDHPRLAGRLRRSRSSSCRRCRATASSRPTAAPRSSPAGPSALSSALLKISGTMQRIPQTDLRAHAEMNAFYIVPAGAKNSVYNLFSTHPPMEKRIEALSAPGGAAAGRARKLRRMGFLDALLGQAQGQGAGARPALRDLDGLRRASTTQQGIKTRGVAGDRLPAAGDGRLPPDRRGHAGGPVRDGRGDGLDGRDQGRRVRLPLDDRAATPTSRTSRSASTRSTTRWPSAATTTACWPPSSPSRTPTASRSTSSTTTSAAAGTRSSPRPASKQRNTERELQIKAATRRRAALRARARALVPPVGDPHLSLRALVLADEPPYAAARAPARARRRPRPVPRRPHAPRPRGARQRAAAQARRPRQPRRRRRVRRASASRTSTSSASRSPGCASAASPAATSTAREPRYTWSQKQATKLLRKLGPVDVMLAHSPPLGVNDDPDDPAHIGLEGLREYVERERPAMLLHGHTYPPLPVERVGRDRDTPRARAPVREAAGTGLVAAGGRCAVRVALVAPRSAYCLIEGTGVAVRGAHAAPGGGLARPGLSGSREPTPPSMMQSARGAPQAAADDRAQSAASAW